MSGPTMHSLFDGSDHALIPSPVDVRAVMEDAARRIYVSAETQDDNDASEALLQARAAVAELIEAMHAAFGPCPIYGSEYARRMQRVRDALARVGGAS